MFRRYTDHYGALSNHYKINNKKWGGMAALR